ncbi:MAG TPA: glycine--tRNA ligase subunit alpha, partial [Candidatus Sulfotelmatobacter sp.]|nr:glycine--tRNA ligase subunit alpha [Candidatus Sulfotelmatobacter sp.]
QFSVYNFEDADVEKTWEHFRLYEAECKGLLDRFRVREDQPHPVSPQDGQTKTEHPSRDKSRFPVLAAYDLCLKCSHLFNILDARGAISVTERVGVIARVRALAVGIAKAWADQQKGNAAEPKPEQSDEPEPVKQKKPKSKNQALSPVG